MPIARLRSSGWLRPLVAYVHRHCSTAAKDVTVGDTAANPSPYRKSRFDWLFGDGYRRPLARDQGGKLRRDWISFGYHATDEHIDWKAAHATAFAFFGILFPVMFFVGHYKMDWPNLREWAFREAYLEMKRREKLGLPYISKDLIDPEKVKLVLPTDEELGDFEIII